MKYYTWEEIIVLSEKNKKVIVTGCQRSGTTIIAKAIANQIGHKHYDENSFGVDNINRFNKLINNDENCVFQAPALLHQMPQYQDKCLIIYVERNPADVVKSMVRVRWFNTHGTREYRKFSGGVPKGPIDVYNIKLEFANTFNNVRLHYDELKKSPLYVDVRNNWSTKQTSNKS